MFSRTPRGSRSKIGLPNSASKRWICRFSAEEVMFMSSAAFLIEPARLTSSIIVKVRKCLIPRSFHATADFNAAILCKSSSGTKRSLPARF